MSNVLSKSDMHAQIVSAQAMSLPTPHSRAAITAMSADSPRTSTFAVRGGRLSLRMESM
jgi:hypothetical protein